MKGTRTPCKLSDPVSHKLNMYALAASAAGMGMLTLARPAEAKIVYTPVYHVIGENEQYRISLNNTTWDFVITNRHCVIGTCPNSGTSALLYASGRESWADGNEVAGGDPWASALRRGAHVPGGRWFISHQAFMASEYRQGGSSPATTGGAWVDVTNRYLGLKFAINGETHYGWARLNVTVVRGKFEITAVLTGYAYETIPNKPIITGKTKGPDVVTVQEDTAPGSLGRLAMGRK